MIEPTKLSINPDAFIYAVNQAFEARSKASGEFNSHLRYEPFLMNSWTLPKNLDFTTFKTFLLEIITHHFNVLPNFHRNEIVDLENISWFSHSVAAFFADLEYLMISFTGNKLPNLQENNIPRVSTSKNIILAIQKYSNYLNNKTEETFSLFPLRNDTEETLDQLYIQEVWSLIASFSRKVFGSYFELIQYYILWKYVPKQIKQEVIDWNVRPPCGIAYYKQFKELFDREKEEKYAKRNEKNNKHLPNKEKSVNNVDEKKHFQRHAPKHVHKEKPYKEKEKFFSKSDENAVTLEQKQQQHLEIALEETRQAIHKMIKNQTLSEFNLAPQNSFIRRQQHSLITESGFETESLGEQRNRHVCIKRKV